MTNIKPTRQMKRPSVIPAEHRHLQIAPFLKTDAGLLSISWKLLMGIVQHEPTVTLPVKALDTISIPRYQNLYERCIKMSIRKTTILLRVSRFRDTLSEEFCMGNFDTSHMSSGEANSCWQRQKVDPRKSLVERVETSRVWYALVFFLMRKKTIKQRNNNDPKDVPTVMQREFLATVMIQCFLKVLKRIMRPW